MNNENLLSDQFEQDPPMLTSTLNVLTILTIIGCSIGLLLTLATPWLMNFSREMLKKASAGTDVSPAQMESMRKQMDLIDLTEKNMVPLLAVGIAGILLCFVGAFMMRKLKKDGYWLYLAGQVIPLIGGFAILGMAQYTGVASYFMPLLTIVFIILYTTQRKYLVY